MANEALATYLNDHLAGAVAALELLDHLAAERAGTDAATVLSTLRAEIESDRQELEALMTQLQIEVSTPRQATAWLVEKLSELKLRLDDPGGGALRRLEALEALSLGIEGKRALWDALQAAGEAAPALTERDYPRLAHRAAEQRAVVERLRLRAAKEALASPP